MNKLRQQFNGNLPQAILFDLDGTLVDSIPDLAAAVDKLRSVIGLPPAGVEQVRLWIGQGARSLVGKAIADYKGDDLPLDKAHQQFLGFYQEVASCHSALYPGVEQCLQQLVKNEIKLAVVTNKPDRFIPSLLANLNIASYFDCVVGADTAGVCKPDPAPLHYAMNELQALPENSLMVGDSITDIDAARNAGVQVVGVSYGYNHGLPIEQSNPDWVVDSLLDLLA